MSEEKKISKESIGEKGFRKSEKHDFTNIEVPAGRTTGAKKIGGLSGDRK